MRGVGLIGLGLLGSAIADRLLAAAYDVVGHDLSAEACQRFERAGGRVAPSAGAVANACEVMILSLPDSKVVAGVVASLDAAIRPGLLIIDTTTGDPDDAAKLGTQLQSHGIDFLEATIAGSSEQLRHGQAMAMVGGDAAVFARARPLIEAVAARSFFVGPWGSAGRMKLVVNLVLGLNRAVLAEGLTLASALGLDQAATLAILKAGPAYSTVMDTKGDKMLAEDFQPQARLSQHAKDVRLILEAARRTGARFPCPACTGSCSTRPRRPDTDRWTTAPSLGTPRLATARQGVAGRGPLPATEGLF